MGAPNDEPAQNRLDAGRQEKAKVVRLLFLQALLTIVMTGAGLFVDTAATVSLLVGSLIGLAATTWLALVLLRPAVAETPGKLLSAFYIGELGKYLFVMAFFAVAFKKIAIVREPHNALLMIGAFAITQLVVWLWPLLKFSGRPGNRS